MVEVPAGFSYSRSRTTTNHPAVGSQGGRTTTDKHSGHDSSGRRGSKSASLAGVGSLGDQTTAIRTPGSGTSSSGKEVASAVKTSRAGAGSESLTTADSRAGAGSQRLIAADSQGAVSFGNRTSSDNSQSTNSETSPADLSTAGTEQADGSHSNAHHRRNVVTVHSAHWPITATCTAWYPEPSHCSLQSEPWKLSQFSLQCQFLMEVWHCPLFPYP